MRSRLVLPLLVVAACRGADLPPESDRQGISEGALTVGVDRQGVHLENRGTAPLRVAVVDSLFFENGLASWCLGQDECGVELLAGGRLLVPPDQVVGPAPRQQAVSVFWWDLRPDLTPEQKSGRFSRIHVRLR